MPIVLLLLGVIDSGHIWPSMVVALGKEKKFKWEGRLYLLIPFFVVLIYFVIGLEFGKFGIYRTHAYLAGFHFIRQQYGVMRLSEVMNPEPQKMFSYIDTFIIYSITTLSILGRSSNEGRWMREGDLISIDSSFFPWFKYAFLTLIAIYFFITIYKLVWKKSFSLSKFLVFFNAAIAWGVIGFTKFPALILFPLFHDLPYFGLIYNYENRYFSETKKIIKKFFKNSTLIFVILFIFIFLYLGSSLEAYLFREYDKKLIPTNAFEVFLVTLAFLPTTAHYFIDAIIWRKGFVPSNLLNFRN